MIRKASLFFHNYFRRSEPNLYDKAVGAAVKIFGIMVAHFTLPKPLSYYVLSDEDAVTLAGKSWKHFTGTHSESETLRLAFERAARVEGYIQPFPYGIKMSVRFYDRGSKEPFITFYCLFDMEGGGGMAGHDRTSVDQRAAQH